MWHHSMKINLIEHSCRIGRLHMLSKCDIDLFKVPVSRYSTIDGIATTVRYLNHSPSLLGAI